MNARDLASNQLLGSLSQVYTHVSSRLDNFIEVCLSIPRTQSLYQEVVLTLCLRCVYPTNSFRKMASSITIMQPSISTCANPGLLIGLSLVCCASILFLLSSRHGRRGLMICICNSDELSMVKSPSTACVLKVRSNRRGVPHFAIPTRIKGNITPKSLCRRVSVMNLIHRRFWHVATTSLRCVLLLPLAFCVRFWWKSLA